MGCSARAKQSQGNSAACRHAGLVPIRAQCHTHRALPACCLPARLPFCSIDEGLVNPDKPWCGTCNFGMAFYDSQSQVGVAGGG